MDNQDHIQYMSSILRDDEALVYVIGGTQPIITAIVPMKAMLRYRLTHNTFPDDDFSEYGSHVPVVMHLGSVRSPNNLTFPVGDSELWFSQFDLDLISSRGLLERYRHIRMVIEDTIPKSSDISDRLLDDGVLQFPLDFTLETIINVRSFEANSERDIT